jgi:AcrR family transcriptional regulator
MGGLDRLAAMGHRELLLEGAVACLREKGYARTTARDIVAASGTNLGSIGYHYGSVAALLDAAVMEAIRQVVEELVRAMDDVDRAAPPAERFERYWTRLLASFAADRAVWLASLDVFGLVDRSPQMRQAIADGLQAGRHMWAELLHGIDPEAEPERAQAVGSLHQALLSGVLVQWLVDPDRTPSAGALTAALRAIAADVT